MGVRNNKRGFTTISLLGVIFLALILMIGLGVMIYGFDLVDDSLLEIDGTIGNLSINETYQKTLQPGIIAAKTTMPRIISVGTLLGMAVVLLLIGFNTGRIGTAWILLDILVIIIAEIVAVVVRSSFVSFINSSPEFLQIFSTTLSTGSKFILLLPTIIPTLGALMLVVTYFITKRKEDPRQF